MIRGLPTTLSQSHGFRRDGTLKELDGQAYGFQVLLLILIASLIYFTCGALDVDQDD